MTEERKVEIIEKFLQWMLENKQDDDELFHILHNEVGMSQEELNDFSIESLDYMFDQEQTGQAMA